MRELIAASTSETFRPDTEPTRLTFAIVPLKFATLLMPVALKFTVDEGVPILAQSRPASPPTLTSSVRAATVGAKREDVATSISVTLKPLTLEVNEASEIVPAVMLVGEATVTGKVAARNPVGCV